MKDFFLLIAGALISAWTGLATARYFEFKQAVRAFTDLLLVPVRGEERNHVAHTTARIDISSRSLGLILIMEDQGQIETAFQIRRDMEFNQTERTKVAAVLCEMPFDPVKAAAAMNEYATSLQVVRRYFGWKPNIWPLWFGSSIWARISTLHFFYVVWATYLETGDPMADITDRYAREFHAASDLSRPI